MIDLSKIEPALSTALRDNVVQRCTLEPHAGGLALVLWFGEGDHETFSDSDEVRVFLQFASVVQEPPQDAAEHTHSGQRAAPPPSPTPEPQRRTAPSTAPQPRHDHIGVEDVPMTSKMRYFYEDDFGGRSIEDVDRPGPAPDFEFSDMYIECLRATVAFAGQYPEIWLSPLLDELRPIASYFNSAPRSFLEFAKAHDLAHIEKRPGDPHDYSVLVLNEKHPTVAFMRDWTGIYITTTDR